MVAGVEEGLNRKLFGLALDFLKCEDIEFVALKDGEVVRGDGWTASVRAAATAETRGSA